MTFGSLFFIPGSSEAALCSELSKKLERSPHKNGIFSPLFTSSCKDVHFLLPAKTDALLFHPHVWKRTKNKHLAEDTTALCDIT